MELSNKLTRKAGDIYNYLDDKILNDILLTAGDPSSSPYAPYRPEDNHPLLLPERQWKDYPEPSEPEGQLELPIQLAGSPSFNINKRAGALGGRSGEQLQRLLKSGLDNKQLNNELKGRNLLPTGINLPRV